MQKEAVLEKLNFGDFYRSYLPSLKGNGGIETKALCPFHDDNTPSLSINLKNGLWRCFACGAKGDAFTFRQKFENITFKDALEKTGREVGVEENNGRGRIVATYNYTDTTGKVLYRKHRIEPGPGGRGKTFKFEHEENDKWVSGRGYEAVPYNLPALAKATYAIVVEGEGKVDLLKGWGLISISLDSGASSPWRDSYLPYFEGKKIAILPDNDDPGRAYAQKIAQALYGKVSGLRIVELPGLEEAGDVVDWQKKGHTKEELITLVKETPPWSPPVREGEEVPGDTPKMPENFGKMRFVPIGKTSPESHFWTPIPLVELQATQDTTTWLWHGFVARGSSTLLSALWKAGKTTLLSHLLKTMSQGGNLAGQEVVKGSALIITEERKGHWLRRRESLSLDGNIDLISRPFKGKPSWPEWSKFISHVDKLLESKQYDLIVIDTLAPLWPVEKENDVGEVTRGVMPLLQWCDKGVSLLLLHHFRKGDGTEAQASRGSGSLTALVDIVLEFRRFDYTRKEDTRRVMEGWSRYEETPLEVVLELSEGRYVTLGSKVESREADRQRVILGILPTDSPGYTVEEVKGQLVEGVRIGTRGVRQALEELYKDGAVLRGGEGKKADPYRYWRREKCDSGEVFPIGTKRIFPQNLELVEVDL
ncbi:MAG TPA: AAA family ATPase [Candidatus Hypogeohydataceae bacterium YC38]